MENSGKTRVRKDRSLGRGMLDFDLNDHIAARLQRYCGTAPGAGVLP